MVDRMSHESTELPIACSLDAGELAGRERRWTRLVRTAGTGRRATSDGIELRFRADDRTGDELRTLVAGERECCAWACWELGHDADGLVMHAHASGDGVATLQAMFLRDA
jgi:hypothetical protein